MKALSMWQPWASLVPLGMKPIETRSWSTRYRGPLAIHAAKSIPPNLFVDRRFRLGIFDVEQDNPRGSGPAYLLRGPIVWPYRLPLGAVVATCTLVDVVPMVEPGNCVGPCVLICNDRSVGYPGPSSSVWGWKLPPGYGHETSSATGIGWQNLDHHRPFGDYRPGRFAWLLADIAPVEPPVPARGRQGLWTWDGGA